MIAGKRPTVRRVPPVWAAVVCTALLVAAVAFGVRAAADDEPAAPDPTAVQAAVSAVRGVMTFAPSDDRARRDAVAASLGGVLAADYAARGPDAVLPGAVGSRITMTVDVTDAAPAVVGPTTARVLLFVDQRIAVDARPETQSRIGTSRWAWLTRVDDRWLLTRLEPVAPQ